MATNFHGLIRLWNSSFGSERTQAILGLIESYRGDPPEYEHTIVITQNSAVDSYKKVVPDPADILTPPHDTYEKYVCDMFGFIKFACIEGHQVTKHERFILVIDDEMDHAFIVWHFFDILAAPDDYGMLLIIGDNCPPLSTKPPSWLIREMVRCNDECTLDTVRARNRASISLAN